MLVESFKHLFPAFALLVLCGAAAAEEQSVLIHRVDMQDFQKNHYYFNGDIFDVNVSKSGSELQTVEGLAGEVDLVVILDGRDRFRIVDFGVGSGDPKPVTMGVIMKDQISSLAAEAEFFKQLKSFLGSGKAGATKKILDLGHGCLAFLEKVFPDWDIASMVDGYEEILAKNDKEQARKWEMSDEDYAIFKKLVSAMLKDLKALPKTLSDKNGASLQDLANKIRANPSFRKKLSGFSTAIKDLIPAGKSPRAGLVMHREFPAGWALEIMNACPAVKWHLCFVPYGQDSDSDSGTRSLFFESPIKLSSPSLLKEVPSAPFEMTEEERTSGSEFGAYTVKSIKYRIQGKPVFGLWSLPRCMEILKVKPPEALRLEPPGAMNVNDLTILCAILRSVGVKELRMKQP